jgi:endonuclease YncB( thermonuclease family)
MKCLTSPDFIRCLVMLCLVGIGPVANSAQDDHRPTPLAFSPFSAKVIGIMDGDTIEVLRGRDKVRIRLHGIDCPEKRQAFGRVARQFTAKLCLGAVVTIHPTDTDRYGRTVRVIAQKESV